MLCSLENGIRARNIITSGRGRENKKTFRIETFPIGFSLVHFYPAADRARQCGGEGSEGCGAGDAVGRGTCMTAQGAMTLRAHSALPKTPATLPTHLVNNIYVYIKL